MGWYRFISPPGLRAIKLKSRGKVQAWAGEIPLTPAMALHPATSVRRADQVRLRIEQERGCYAGVAIPEPIQLDCGPGQISLGDWASIEGLACYSGSAWYRKTVTIPAVKQVTLDLGRLVSSAELRVNGQQAGVRVSPPWTFDVTKFVRPGDNRLELRIYNTLGNHYPTVPTGYRGSTVAGLLGPVSLKLENPNPKP